MRKKEPKRDVILKSAKELYWKYGFKRVSVEEICKKAEISKMTFYRFFSSKIEVAKGIFDKEMQEGILKFRSVMQEDIHPGEKIKKIILLNTEGTNNMSSEFMADFFTSSEPELKEFIERGVKNVWNEVIKDLKKAQQKGWFTKNIKPELLMHISLKSIEIISDKELLKLYSTPQELLIEYVNLISYGITKK